VTGAIGTADWWSSIAGIAVNLVLCMICLLKVVTGVVALVGAIRLAKPGVLAGGAPLRHPAAPPAPRAVTISAAWSGGTGCRTSPPEPLHRKARLKLWSYDKMILSSALDTVELLAPTPLLVLAGDRAETLGQSEALYAKAQEPRELFRIEGGRHFDFYDRPAYVAQAIAKIDAFLKQHL
jgi:fermentation-respiration switch protein FrsA (DUF1100 family)